MRHSTTVPASRILALLVATATLALGSAAAQVPAPPLVQPAQPRDAAPAASGTAVIAGRVTNLETGGPLQRAVIRIASPALSSERRVSTNADGRYEVRDLPAGDYSLNAERGGYLTIAYGQRRPGEAGKPLQVGEGQTVKAIDFALPRLGVISGRVIDETGEAIAKVTVWAMQFGRHQGVRRLIPFIVPAECCWSGGHAMTDESGQYSLLLPPGEFVVMVQSRETWPLESDPMQVFGYPPSFYPGVIETTEAQRIKLGVGQEVQNIDFALVPARTARVSGTVVNAAGAPVANEPVTLSQEIMGPQGGSIFPSSNAAQTGPDGRFSVNNVQAGEYVLAVRAAAGNDRPAQEARQMIQVAGADIDGLVIVTGSGGTVRGQVVSDDGTPVPGIDRLSVRARPLTWAARKSTLASPGRVNADGTFELKGLFGPVVLTVGTLTGDWTLKAVELSGRDLADDPIEVPHGQSVSVRVVLTNRPTQLRGGLLDEKQEPVDGTIVVFPEETSRWREDSRTVRAARPDQRGEFFIKGLPPGNYLIAAVEHVQDGQWYDPDFLADLRPRAKRLSLAEAEHKRIDVTLKK